MEIETVFLAEDFTLDDSARLTIHNIYDIVNVATLPTIWGPFNVFMRLKTTGAPIDELTNVSVYVLEPFPSQRKWRLIDTLSLDLRRLDQDAGFLNVGIQIGGIPLEKEGTRTLGFKIGKKEIKSMRFKVNQIPGEKTGLKVASVGT